MTVNEQRRREIEEEDTRTEFRRWADDYLQHRLSDLDSSAAHYVYTMMQGAILCASELFQRPSEETVVEVFRHMMRRAETPDEVLIRSHPLR